MPACWPAPTAGDRWAGIRRPLPTRAGRASARTRCARGSRTSSRWPSSVPRISASRTCMTGSRGCTPRSPGSGSPSSGPRRRVAGLRSSTGSSRAAGESSRSPSGRARTCRTWSAGRTSAECTPWTSPSASCAAAEPSCAAGDGWCRSIWQAPRRCRSRTTPSMPSCTSEGSTSSTTRRAPSRRWRAWPNLACGSWSSTRRSAWPDPTSTSCPVSAGHSAANVRRSAHRSTTSPRGCSTCESLMCGAAGSTAWSS